MKTIAFIIFSAYFVFTSLGNGDLPIYKNVNYVKNYDLITSGYHQLFISSPFAKSELEIPTDVDFNGKQVKRVTYLYSHNNHNTEFAQSELSEERYNNLLAQLPQVDFSEAEWNTQVQTGCGSINCSRKLNHGFIIEFECDKALIGHANLNIQKRMIPNDQDMTLTFEQGTKLDIPANAFVDAFGNEVEGTVYVHVQEAYALEDIVSANLLTVTNKGDYLESRGMINVEAYQGKSQLYLKSGKEIMVHLPREIEDGFSHFEGEIDSGELVWNRPILIEKEQVKVQVNNDNNQVNVINGFIVDSVRNIEVNEVNRVNGNIIVMSWGHTNGVLSNIRMMVQNEEIQVWRNKSTAKYLESIGLRPNEVITIKKWFEIQDVKLNIQVVDENPENGRRFVFGNFFMGEGGNDHTVDTDVDQVFKMKKLGWANVDRLYNTGKPTKLNVAQESINDLEHFDISLVIPSKNMFIPGYQKKDGLFSFTHGDYEEKMPMPLGDAAYVIAIGQKDDQTYFQLKKITLGELEVEVLELSPIERDDALKIIQDTL